MQEKTNNDEIDLFEFFKLIKKGFNKLGLLILKLFVFVKRNAILFIALIVVGGGLGYYLDSLKQTVFKSSITVKTNYGSKNFLYESIEEINWDIENDFKTASKKLNIPEDEVRQLKINIKPISNINSLTEEQNEYLELLSERKLFDEEEINMTIITNTDFHKLIFISNHKIDFNKLYENIRENYLKNKSFQRIHEINITNLKKTINLYENNITQINEIIKNYNKKLISNENNQSTFYNSENTLNIKGLIEEKKALNSGISELNIRINKEKDFIYPLSNAKTSQIDKSPTDHKKILLPLLLIVLFFGVKLLIFINKKANQLQANSDD